MELYADVTITPAEVERRATLMEEARVIYSRAFRAREAAEAALSGMTEKRAGLTSRCDELRAGLRAERDAALIAAVGGSGFAPRAATVQAFQQQHDLMHQARAWFDAFAFADSERAALDAKVDELQAQVACEQARAEHHEAHVLLLISQAAQLNQGLRVEGFDEGVAGAMSALLIRPIRSATVSLRFTSS